MKETLTKARSPRTWTEVRWRYDRRANRQRKFKVFRLPGGIHIGVGAWFDPRDLWVGIHWTPSDHLVYTTAVSVCLIPTLPIRFEVSWYGRKARQWANERKAAERARES